MWYGYMWFRQGFLFASSDAELFIRVQVQTMHSVSSYATIAL